MKKLEQLLELGGTKRDILFLVISGLSLLSSIAGFRPFPFDMAWIAIVLCGIPIILEAVIGLVTAFDIKADVLVSIALIASVIIGEDFAAGEVAFIMQIGALLEDLTVARARAGIERLVHLTPRTARRITKDKEEIIPLRRGSCRRHTPGASRRIHPCGRRHPLRHDVRGSGSHDRRIHAGGIKVPGDDVSSGTVNQFGAFEMKAVKVGEDSSIQRMIRLVQSADAGKAKIVGIADRWATWIVVIALTAAALTWLISGEIIRAVTILVVFCPCALVLATPPLSWQPSETRAKHGFLVREGDALERLANVTHIAFDKTGTLTFGTPQVTAVVSLLPELSDDMLYEYAAVSELNSDILSERRSSDAAEKNPLPPCLSRTTSVCFPDAVCLL